MSVYTRLLHRICCSLNSPFTFSLTTFITTLALDAAVTRSLPHHILHRLYACVVVFVLLYGREWVLQKKLRRMDDYQVHTYHQNNLVRAAAHNIQKQLNDCNHNFDYAHEQCRAQARRQVMHLLSAIGEGPVPVLILPGKELEPLCVNIMHGIPRCQYVQELSQKQPTRNAAVV